MNKFRLKDIMRNFSQEAKNLKSPETINIHAPTYVGDKN